MKAYFLVLALGVGGMGSTWAQNNTNDLQVKLENEKKIIDLKKTINDYQLQLTKLRNELTVKTEATNKLEEVAQKSAEENQQIAAQLASDSQNKSLANKARNAARKAEKDAKTARKSANGKQKLESEIENLQKNIAEKENDLNGMAATVSEGNTHSNSVSSVEQKQQISQASGAYKSEDKPQAGSDLNARKIPEVDTVFVNQEGSKGTPMRIDNPINRPQQMKGTEAEKFANAVVESTYRNYPQQPGQPAIIINNIIFPTDYQSKPGKQTGSPVKKTVTENEDPSDYEEYLAWKRQKSTRFKEDRPSVTAEEPVSSESNYSSSRLTFKDRFAESKSRKSGMWVIPLVGVHASNFNADFSNNKAEGRTGWNAGLDFRIRTRRFFVQPGVHYFNSSLSFTDKDSLSKAPLWDGPRIHSLKVPVMLGLYLTKANSGFFKFNIKGGGSANYVMAVDKQDQKKFSKDNIEEFSYGLLGGVGLEFGFITIDLSHEWGVSKFLKNDNSKNNILRATLGIKL